MSDNRFVFEGLDELRASLRALPEELTARAGRIVTGASIVAAQAVQDAYADGKTGHLRGGVKVTHFEAGRFSAGAIVKSSAPHAWMYENGTQARHYITKNGKTHLTGAMPPAHIFVPTVMRVRKEMYESLKTMLVENGLEVSGDE